MSEYPSERLPQDLAAERAVLGGILVDNQVFVDIATLLQPDDFHLPAHAAIYEAMLALQRAMPPRPVDQVTVTSELKTQGKLTAAGGPAYLAELETSISTTANTAFHARLVQDKSLKRRLMRAGQEIAELAVEPSTKVEELLDQAQQKVFALSERRQEGDLKPFSEVVDHTLEQMDKLKASGAGITGLSTGFVDLDHMLTGFHEGELIILAARPGVGKTSLAINIATHAALRSKKPAAIFSLEMPQDQLAQRILSAETRVDMKRIREVSLTPQQNEKIQHAASELWNAPLYIDDSGSLSAFDLRTKLRRLQSRLSSHGTEQGLGLVVVDYLQLMHQKGADSRQTEVQMISRSLKSIAKELKVPVLALSQLNRKVEERRGQKGKPMLSDLRESGAIEQDADVVMFIHKDLDELEENPPAPGQGMDVELIIAKQRNGPTGSVNLLLFSECTRFENKLQETR